MEDFLTTKEAAAVLGVSEGRVKHLISQERLPSQRFGRAHLILRADVEQFERQPEGWQRGRPRIMFAKAWQAMRAERTAEILMGRGYWAEVYSGRLPIDHLCHFVLTTAPVEELAAVREQVQEEWDAEVIAAGHQTCLHGLGTDRKIPPKLETPGTYALGRYQAWLATGTMPAETSNDRP